METKWGCETIDLIENNRNPTSISKINHHVCCTCHPLFFWGNGKNSPEKIAFQNALFENETKPSSIHAWRLRIFFPSCFPFSLLHNMPALLTYFLEDWEVWRKDRKSWIECSREIYLPTTNFVRLYFSKIKNTQSTWHRAVVLPLFEGVGGVVGEKHTGEIFPDTPITKKTKAVPTIKSRRLLNHNPELSGKSKKIWKWAFWRKPDAHFQSTLR